MNDEWVDIGHDVVIQYFHYSREMWPASPKHCGLIVKHPRSDGKECLTSLVWWAPPGWDTVKWKREVIEPLTISPSFICQCEEIHGWIREGKWVPA